MLRLGDPCGILRVDFAYVASPFMQLATMIIRKKFAAAANNKSSRGNVAKCWHKNIDRNPTHFMAHNHLSFIRSTHWSVSASVSIVVALRLPLFATVFSWILPLFRTVWRWLRWIHIPLNCNFPHEKRNTVEQCLVSLASLVFWVS